MIERRLPHLDDFTIHTGLEHAIAVQSTAKMPNLPAQLPVLLLQRKNMRDACEIDTLVLAQLLRLRKTRHVTKRLAPRTTSVRSGTTDQGGRTDATSVDARPQSEPPDSP